jgi:hypothetical protein
MSVLYAFCREVDDVADDESESEKPPPRSPGRLARGSPPRLRWQTPTFPVARELQPVIAQYHLPFAYFDELIRGVEMDLDIKRYETYEALEQYCYRVASVVGLLSVEIFGYKDPACRDYAIHLGKALQLTNILRDVRTDAERGRIYLPQSELERCQVTPEEILRGVWSERFEQLAAASAREAQKILRPGPANAPRRRPPLHGRRRVDGFGLLASAAQAGTPAFPRLRAAPPRAWAKARKPFSFSAPWCRSISALSALRSAKVVGPTRRVALEIWLYGYFHRVRSPRTLEATLQEPWAQSLYQQRRQIVERRFGQLKQHDGFRRWTVWGLEAVRTQWSLLCTTLNLRVLYQRWRQNRPAGPPACLSTSKSCRSRWEQNRTRWPLASSRGRVENRDHEESAQILSGQSPRGVPTGNV